MPTPNDAFIAVLNRAANDVIEALDLPDEGKRDVINLVVNTTAHYLDYPEATLDEAIEDGYGEDPAVVLSWCQA